MSDYKIYAKYNNSIVEVMSQPSKLSELTDDLGSSPTHTHSQYLTKSSTDTCALSITGNAATATKATKDASGNVITETYTPLDLGVWSAS